MFHPTTPCSKIVFTTYLTLFLDVQYLQESDGDWSGGEEVRRYMREVKISPTTHIFYISYFLLVSKFDSNPTCTTVVRRLFARLHWGYKTHPIIGDCKPNLSFDWPSWLISLHIVANIYDASMLISMYTILYETDTLDNMTLLEDCALSDSPHHTISGDSTHIVDLICVQLLWALLKWLRS